MTIDAWPPLDVGGGSETRQSLLYWGQIVGKTRLALCPPLNHWWHVPFKVSARGLAGSPMPFGDQVFDIELDLIDHRLVARPSGGAVGSLALHAQPLAQFYAEYQRLLH